MVLFTIIISVYFVLIFSPKVTYSKLFLNARYSPGVYFMMCHTHKTPEKRPLKIQHIYFSFDIVDHLKNTKEENMIETFIGRLLDKLMAFLNFVVIVSVPILHNGLGIRRPFNSGINSIYTDIQTHVCVFMCIHIFFSI